MKPQELQKRIGELFARVPLVPVVIEATDGRRWFADLPSQVRQGPLTVEITPPAGPSVFLPYDKIARVVPLDELPAEPGGMGYNEFYAAVRPLRKAEPFHPFVIEFRSGKRLAVEVGKRLLLSGRFGVYMPADRPGVVRFTYDQVARVTNGKPVGMNGHA